MAELNAATERLTSERLQRFQLTEELVARVLGAAVAVIGIFAVTYPFLHDHDVVAGVIGGGTLAAIVAALVKRGTE